MSNQGFRLSPQQRRLWALTREADEGTSVFRAQCAFDLEGELDVAALRRAVDRVVERHEILRTSLHGPSWKKFPLQVIHDHATPRWRELDLSDGAASLTPETAFTGEGEAPFRYRDESLMRLALLRLGRRRHRLVVTLPALCADAVTLHNLLAELGELYAGRQPDSADDETVQYLEFSEWQLDTVDAGDGDAAAYWGGKLAALAQPIELPWERPRPEAAAFVPRFVPVAVAPRVGEYLTAAGGEAAEAFFLACFKVLLGRLSRGFEVPVGVVSDCRTFEEFAPAFGAFAKTLPVVTELGRGYRFEELVQRLARALEESREQQDLLAWENGTRQSPADDPSLEREPPMELELRRRPAGRQAGDLAVSVAEEYVCTGPFKLKLLVVEEGDSWKAELWYDARRFDRLAARSLAAQLAALFTAASRDPRRSLWQLGMLSAADRHRLLIDWHDVARPRAPHRRIPEWLADRVARHPDRVAIVFEDETLTYGELGARVRRLACHLRGLGLGPEDRVAILDQRSPWFLTGLLAVLEAGGAYVPLDPSYPREQLAAMFEDSGGRFVLTRRLWLEKLDGLPVTAVLPNAAQRNGADSPTGGALLPGPPGALAYVLFTSGSTGRPKGVAVEHRALVDYVAGAIERLEIDDGGSFAVASTFAADLGHTMLFPALVTGGRLHIVSTGRASTPDAFAELIDGRRVDHLKIVPSHLRALLSASRPERVVPRRRLVLGGETLAPELVERIGRLAPGCRVFNHYGPTEATVGVTAAEVRAVPRPICLGRPLAGSQVYLLDARMQPVPAAAPGEIHLGGTGLARGYLGRPGLTAERFVPHPFSREQPDQRLYKTGDLARFTAGGELEFLGRIDHQVKLRGFRIELGAIEAVLTSHPGIAEAVALVRHDRPGENRLVAYSVSPRRAPVDAAEVLEFLRRKLPEPMVPAVLVPLESLPLTANGKVDRGVLPAPEGRDREARRIVAPRTAVEKQLAAIWAELLSLPAIDIHRSFFELGGDSIQAIRVIARAQRVGLVVQPQDIFRHPTIARLARVVQETPPGRREATAEISRQPRDRPLPLSFAQERLWFLQRLEPESPAYNVPRALRFTGPLSPAFLAAVLSALVRRHEVLRTTFALATRPSADGSPLQVVGRPRPVPLPIVDLAALPRQRRRRLARALSAAEARRPFDLERGPILRATLLRLGDDDHVVLVTLHHIASDAWSTDVLVREMVTLYGGETPRLPELPIQYADFAYWQRRSLTGEILEGQLDYWRLRLAGGSPVLELPTDRARGAVSRPRSGRLPWRLSAGSTGALAALARSHDASLFMALLAALQALLGRLSGQDDVRVGVPVANRDRPETEHLVGCFLNTLVFRSDLAGEPGFGAFLDQVRETALEAYQHQDLPFEKLVAELEPERSLLHTPLFQVMLVLENVHQQNLELPGMVIEPFAPQKTAEKFDFTLWLAEVEDGLEGYLSYNAALFDATTIRRLLKHLETLLAGAVSDPSRRISDLPLLRPAEAHQLVAEWAGEGRREPAALLPELFTTRAAQIGEASALVCGEQWWSYGELEHRSRRLARVLEARGAGPEVPVAALVDRGPEMVLALLAVLRSGSVYVPLDAAQPQRRLAEILAAVDPHLVLTPKRLAERLPEWHGNILSIDDPAEPAAPGARDGDPRPGTPRPESSACVFHTSGSTGRPKGIAGTHASASAYLLDLVRRWQLGPGDVTLQLASPGFDAVLRDFLGPLAAGARVVLAGDRGARDPRVLLGEMRRQRVSCLPSLVPSQLTALLRAAGEPRPERLRLILASGEVLPAESFSEARRAFGPGLTLVNQYGPSECTMTSSLHVLRSAPAAGTRVAIGRGLPYASLRVTDRRLAPVPSGVRGELLIAGAGVARGYLGQPALTAAVFIPDPAADVPGARAYRTGDEVCFRADGQLDYLGRLDRQVKLSGNRLEPGEVEAVLRRHPAVAEAAVAVRQAPGGGPFLAAYVATAPAAAASSHELRRFLRARLPAWAVPGAVVCLSELPRTATGKLDRRALAVADRAAAPERSHAPRSVPSHHPLAEVLASIWAEVLGIDRVGIDEDFFELGGHSLLATQVLSRVRRLLAAELPLRALFEAPTPAGLARRIEALDAGRQGLEQPPPLVPAPVAPAPAGEDAPLSFAQERLWFLDRLAPGNPAYNLPAAVLLRGRLDRRAFERGLAEIVRRHDVLRTTFHTAGGQPRQRVAPSGDPDLPMADLSALGEAERRTELRRLAGAEARFAFDLTRGALRTVLVRLDEAEHAVLLTQHHIVSDGWSIGLLVRELGTLYGAFTRCRPSPLDPPRLSYADYARWQRRWHRGETLAAQIEWWRQRLEGVPELELPTDRPRPAVRGGHGARQQKLLRRIAPSRLAAVSRDAGATPFMTLLAVWQVLLHRTSGQPDFAVGTPVAHRNRIELEDLVGFLVNTLVLRARLEARSTFRDLVARTRETVLGAFAHQDVPFEKLVAELEPRRDLSRQPLFQVMFAFQNVPRVSAEFAGLRVSRLQNEVRSSRFDLTLALTETEDGYLATLDYDTDLFDDTSAQRLLGHFETLAAGALHRAALRLAELPLATAAERHQVLIEWGTADAEATGETTLHGLFERQARRRGDAVAVVGETCQLSYGELDRQADRLAELLRGAGLGPDDVVGLRTERRPEAVVAILAILKAGCAYLPLDPALPAERLRHIIREAGARLVLTPSAPGDAFDPHPAAESHSTGPTGSNLAYVIYTSGSTGKPKGVMVSHRSICQTLRWRSRRFALTAHDRLLQSVPMTFDPSLWQIFGPLISGGVLVLDHPGPQELPRLAKRMADQRITITDFPPSMLEILVQSRLFESCPSLRLLFVGGELFPAQLETRLLALSDAAVYNIYGPTEGTIDAACWRCRGDGGARGVAIGRPVADKRLSLLAPNLAPVPVAVPGELYVGRDALARGYLGRPGASAEKFVPDPYAVEPGGRLYRTGDRARLRADGALEFLGRTDRQVKIRGLRIELEEIEAVLASHPRAREAAVIVDRGAADEKRLVAYVGHDGEAPPSAGELDAFLRRRLPAYMVPAAFVRLERLPLSSHGKVDRRALPPPPGDDATPERDFVPPRGELERRVAAIWRDLLQRDRVGVFDNFFDLGGHSLLLVRLHARLSDELGREIPMVDLFQYPTVSSLTRRLAPSGEAEDPFAAELARAQKQRQALARQQHALLAARGERAR